MLILQKIAIAIVFGWFLFEVEASNVCEWYESEYADYTDPTVNVSNKYQFILTLYFAEALCSIVKYLLIIVAIVKSNKILARVY